MLTSGQAAFLAILILLEKNNEQQMILDSR